MVQTVCRMNIPTKRHGHFTKSFPLEIHMEQGMPPHLEYCHACAQGGPERTHGILD